MEDPRSVLIAGAARFGCALDERAAGLLLEYLRRLLAINETLNLTSVRDPAEAVERHLLDSLAFGLHAAEAGDPRRLVDVGTGGGFPGVPIAVAWPRAEVHVVDSTGKKVRAVEQILREIGIANVAAHWTRADSLAGVPPADAVTVRAVGSLAECVRSAERLLAPGGCCVVWKSEDVPDDERREGTAAARRAGMDSLPDLVYQLGRKRRLVRFRRRP